MGYLLLKNGIFDFLSCLPHDDLDVVQGNPLVVAPDDELEQVVTEDLEDHAHVGAVDTAYLEVV